MRKFVGLLITLLVISTLVPISRAQNNEPEERITLSPAVSRPELDAGESATGKLTVINDGSTAYTFVVYARPFSVSGENYDPNYTEVNDRTEAYQWVQFKETKLDLKPGERVQVEYVVTVPKDAAGGGHYAVLFAETQPPEGNANVARKKRVGSLLYMTISGDVIEQGSIASWEAKTFQTQEPIEAAIRIKNDGNVHFQADTSVQYSDIFGRKRLEINRELLILPGTTRKVPMNWDTPPYFGIFKVSGHVDYLDKTENLSTKWVVLMPWPIMVALVLIVLALIVLVTRGRRKKKSRVSSGAGKV